MTAVNYRSEDVDGLKIFYREAGRADAPALLLLHGFPSASHMFRDLIPLLADRFHRIADGRQPWGEMRGDVRVAEPDHGHDSTDDTTRCGWPRLRSRRRRLSPLLPHLLPPPPHPLRRPHRLRLFAVGNRIEIVKRRRGLRDRRNGRGTVRGRHSASETHPADCRRRGV